MRISDRANGGCQPVPAGGALAVDRDGFSKSVEDAWKVMTSSQLCAKSMVFRQKTGKILFLTGLTSAP